MELSGTCWLKSAPLFNILPDLSALASWVFLSTMQTTCGSALVAASAKIARLLWYGISNTLTQGVWLVFVSGQQREREAALRRLDNQKNKAANAASTNKASNSILRFCEHTVL